MIKNNIYYFVADEFVEKVTTLIFKKFQQKINQNKKINIALSGGNTPIPILKKLATYNLDWEKINFFIVDERCVPIDHHESNFGAIHKVFFSNIKANAFSMIKLNKTFEECAFDYETIITEKIDVSKNGLPIFDIIFLGMGTDGHTASLFPETEGLLEEKKIVFLNDVPQLNTTRITFSYSLLLNAKEIIVLASGEKKAEIIKEIYEDISNTYPISRIAYKHKNLNWYMSK